MIETEFYPRTVLSGTEHRAGVTVERVRMGRDVGPSLMLTPCGGRWSNNGGGRLFWPKRAEALRDAIQEALR